MYQVLFLSRLSRKLTFADLIHFKKLKFPFSFIGYLLSYITCSPIPALTLLSFKTKASGVFKGFMFFPYLVCGIAVGFIFKFFYTRGFVLDTVLQWCGFELDNLPYWLRDTKINNFSVAATSIWRYMGQNMVLFIGAIMSVDSSLYEAAAIDGASGWDKFKYKTRYGKNINPLNTPLAFVLKLKRDAKYNASASCSYS